MARAVPADPLHRQPPAAVVCRLGLPLALGMVSHVLFNLFDMYLVGRLGPEAVAAAGVATALNFLPMILGNGVSVASISLLSQALGAGDRQRARELSTRSQVLMLWLGLILGGIAAATAVPCVNVMELSGTTRTDAIHYLVVSSLGTVTMFALMQVTASMRALGETAMPVGLLVGANVLNIALDVVLLFGWDAVGIPAQGVVGAAYATVFARALGAVAGYLWLARPGHALRMVRRCFRPMGWLDRRGLWGSVLRKSLPQSTQMLVRALAVLWLLRVSNDLGGDDAVAAVSMAIRLDTVILFGALGFASAGTTVAGRAVAAGDPFRARRVGFQAALQALAFGSLFVVVFALWPEFWVHAFIEDPGPGVLAHGRDYLRIAILGQPFAAFAIGAAGAANGAGRMVAPMVLDVIGYLGLMLPALTLYATFATAPDTAGAFLLFALANALLAILHGGYLAAAGWAERAPAALSE